MSLQRKEKCPYHDKDLLGSLHPEYIQFPQLCPWCKGTLEIELGVNFEHFDEPFHTVDWETISDYSDDIFIEFHCQCGERIVFGESGTSIACVCGRVYNISMTFGVNEDHIGDTNYLIEKCRHERL